MGKFVRTAFVATAMLLLLVPVSVFGQRYGEDLCVDLLTNDTAPTDNGLEGDEWEDQPNSLTNTVRSQLFIYKAAADEESGTAAGRCVILCPGGAYRRLVMDREGYAFAQWLAENGITAAVLKYRLPNGHPEVPIEDVRAAVDYLEANAEALGIDTAHLGVIGFSAGGHLAAMAATEEGICDRLAFAALFYPVITDREEYAEPTSMKYLLGEGWRQQSGRSDYGAERRVNGNTPPVLLLLADDDRVVSPLNSTMFYDALKRSGIQAEMHVYPSGGHGWDLRKEGAFCQTWKRTLLEWIRAH